jgi:hypothetical protein
MHQRLTTFLISLLLPTTGVVGLETDINDQVYRITANKCGPTSEGKNRIQTGFRAETKNGIRLVTALHGVVGCTVILAWRQDISIDDLKLDKVDVFHDAALLYSVELINDPRPPLKFSTYLGKSELKVVGYPRGITSELSHRVNFHEKPQVRLKDLIPPELIQAFDDRDSPDIEARVLSLTGSIQPGYSGAPILDSAQRVIAVANGGLAGGSANIGWAIPYENITWHDKLEYQVKLKKLTLTDLEALFETPYLEAELETSSTVGRVYAIDADYIMIKLDAIITKKSPIFLKGRYGKAVKLKIERLGDGFVSVKPIASIHKVTVGDYVYVEE